MTALPSSSSLGLYISTSDGSREINRPAAKLTDADLVSEPAAGIWTRRGHTSVAKPPRACPHDAEIVGPLAARLYLESSTNVAAFVLLF
jgi:hypothetical protein